MNASGVPLLDFVILEGNVEITTRDWIDALTPAVAFMSTLAAHELGHWWAARKNGMQLYLPLLVPSGFGFLGSFGGITRFRGFCPDRRTLLEVGSAGPLSGAAVSLALVFVGFLLTTLGQVNVAVESDTFANSLFMGAAASAVLGADLLNDTVPVNSLLLAGWAGLLVSALNSIPAGELDGGRVALAVFGRQPATLLGILTVVALGFSAFTNALSFYWVLIVLLLQRGPLLPCLEEISSPPGALDAAPTTKGGSTQVPALPESNREVVWGLLMLALPLLVLLPLPIDLINEFSQLGDATLLP